MSSDAPRPIVYTRMPAALTAPAAASTVSSCAPPAGGVGTRLGRPSVRRIITGRPWSALSRRQTSPPSRSAKSSRVPSAMRAFSPPSAASMVYGSPVSPISIQASALNPTTATRSPARSI